MTTWAEHLAHEPIHTFSRHADDLYHCETCDINSTEAPRGTIIDVCEHLFLCSRPDDLSRVDAHTGKPLDTFRAGNSGTVPP